MADINLDAWASPILRIGLDGQELAVGPLTLAQWATAIGVRDQTPATLAEKYQQMKDLAKAYAPNAPAAKIDALNPTQLFVALRALDRFHRGLSGPEAGAESDVISF